MISLLDQFLALLDVGVTAFTACDVRRGWRLDFAASRAATLHYCLEGVGVMQVSNGPALELAQHSFALLPPGVVYSIEAVGEATAEHSIPHRRLAAPPFRESVPTIQAGDGEAGILTACGDVHLLPSWTPGFFTGFDVPLVEHFDGSDGLHDRFVLLLAEIAQPRTGTRALTEALLKQCLVLLLRRHLDCGAGAAPWLVGLTDQRIAAALAAIFARPSEPFTVESLARIAGMSRATFAARFVRLFGRSPISFLRDVRLRRASELLVTTELSVESIGRKAGFPSRSNFSRAFRLRYGVDPSGFRAGSTEPPASAQQRSRSTSGPRGAAAKKRDDLETERQGREAKI
jgi:AraC family transcriptional regulator, activator of mtrCDE